jgi:hypothetical protein
VFRHPRRSPFASPTSVVNALESALRPSSSHTSRSRLTVWMSAGRDIRIEWAASRSFARAGTLTSLQMQIIGRRRGRFPWVFSPFRPTEEFLNEKIVQGKCLRVPPFFRGLSCVSCTSLWIKPRFCERYHVSKDRRAQQDAGHRHQSLRRFRPPQSTQASCC